MATLIKIDRNGSKHYEGMVTCDRCGGTGYYAIAVCNNQPVLSPLDGGVCYKCLGKGKVLGKWIERTPEYQAKLDARREAKRKAKQAELDAKMAEQKKIWAERKAQWEAEKAEREAKIKAEKAISQYVGEAKERMTIKVTYVGSPSFEVSSFRGWGTDEMYIHTFKDDQGNKLVWKTTSPLDRNAIDEGDVVELTGTVKDHNEYKEEKQTVLTRCKVKALKAE